MRVTRNKARRLVFQYKFYGKLKIKLREIINRKIKEKEVTKEWIESHLKFIQSINY